MRVHLHKSRRSCARRVISGTAFTTTQEANMEGQDMRHTNTTALDAAVGAAAGRSTRCNGVRPRHRSIVTCTGHVRRVCAAAPAAGSEQPPRSSRALCSCRGSCGCQAHKPAKRTALSHADLLHRQHDRITPGDRGVESPRSPSAPLPRVKTTERGSDAATGQSMRPNQPESQNHPAP